MGEFSCGGRNSEIGKRGEAIAVAYLKGLKYRIIERNYRCRCGEIDIVARDGSTLVFVEVKARRNLAYGVPQLAVTSFKQRQISKAALNWLSHHRLEKEMARFDVVAVLLGDHEVPVVEHFQNAFDLSF